MDRDAEQRDGSVGFDQLHLGGAGHTAVDPDRLRERTFAAGYVAADPDKIGLIDLLFRVHQRVGQFSVVGQEQQSLGIAVEPTDGIDALRQVRDQLGDGAAALFIVHGGHEAARLAEHAVDLFRLLPRPDTDAVELDDVLFPVRLLAEADGIAVDAHAAVRDQLLSLAAGDAGAARQNFLQSFFHTILLFCG